MSVIWHSTSNERAPEGVILLVYGPLGVDLAVNMAGKWYFKAGDDWSRSNLEYWSFNPPTEWAEISLPLQENSRGGLALCERPSGENSILAEDTDFEFLAADMDIIAQVLSN